MTETGFSIEIFDIDSIEHTAKYKVISHSIDAEDMPDDYVLFYIAYRGKILYKITKNNLEGTIHDIYKNIEYEVYQYSFDPEVDIERSFPHQVFSVDDGYTDLCANDFEKYINSSLSKYFDLLRYEGYARPQETNKLIVLDMIEELLYGELSICLNRKDAKLLEAFARSLYGSSCMFPMPVNCISGLTFDDEGNNVDCDLIVDPVKTGYWNDNSYWQDNTQSGANKIWNDQGCN